jgi:hypothetical protein
LKTERRVNFHFNNSSSANIIDEKFDNARSSSALEDGELSPAGKSSLQIDAVSPMHVYGV